MPKKIDLTGQIYGKLTVIREADKRIKNKVTWHCICECGNEIDVTSNSLRTGNTKSCGCFQKQKLIERNLSNSTVKIGNKYGKLLIIKDLGLRPQKSRKKNERWSLCKCDCGNEIEVPNNMLQSGWKQSCGCLRSKGELKIEQILKENNINYSKQYSFKNLTGIHNGLLKFDFAIFNENNQIDFLLEFDGRQHTQGYDTLYWKHYSNEEIQEHDKRKNQYCKQHNIILKRIPYTDINILNYELIMSNKYII